MNLMTETHLMNLMTAPPGRPPAAPARASPRLWCSASPPTPSNGCLYMCPRMCVCACQCLYMCPRMCVCVCRRLSCYETLAYAPAPKRTHTRTHPHPNAPTLERTHTRTRPHTYARACMQTCLQVAGRRRAQLAGMSACMCRTHCMHASHTLHACITHIPPGCGPPARSARWSTCLTLSGRDAYAHMM